MILGCEEIYNPEIEKVENAVVAEARLVYGQDENLIRLTRTLSFNEDLYAYPQISGASVALVDSKDTEYPLPETGEGYFRVNFEMDPNESYKLRIEYAGDTYESTFETIPEVPALDKVYGIPETKIIINTGENDITERREVEGIRLYADITGEPAMPYYRFTSKRIMQYVYEVEISMGGIPEPVPVYAWKTYYPQEPFNLAAPPQYSSSNNIIKHPTFFFEKAGYVSSDESFAGWIVYLYQHGLSESAHDYYTDLNSQLLSEGRLFDPLYVQARNNIKCINNPEKLILGNFEISTIVERRYFVKFISEKQGYYISEIPYFYDIPNSGDVLQYHPEFWEYPNKQYPDE
jgi:hypothetical protein